MKLHKKPRRYLLLIEVICAFFIATICLSIASVSLLQTAKKTHQKLTEACLHEESDKILVLIYEELKQKSTTAPLDFSRPMESTIKNFDLAIGKVKKRFDIAWKIEPLYYKVSSNTCTRIKILLKISEVNSSKILMEFSQYRLAISPIPIRN